MQLTQAAAAAGISTMPLASPAPTTRRHSRWPALTCMLFVRNSNGSHNPHEAMEISDFLDAAIVLTEWLVRRVAI